jgi:ABC-type spermidine/putrescine transport system permease subunit I
MSSVVNTNYESSLCKYKDIFGKVGEGVHSVRLFNIAVVDLLGTLLIAYIIAYLLHKIKILAKISIYIIFLIVFIILMILALFLHRLFCVRTTLTKIVFDI